MGSIPSGGHLELGLKEDNWGPRVDRAGRTWPRRAPWNSELEGRRHLAGLSAETHGTLGRSCSRVVSDQTSFEKSPPLHGEGMVVTRGWTLAWVVRGSWGHRDRFKGDEEPATSWWKWPWFQLGPR